MKQALRLLSRFFLLLVVLILVFGSLVVLSRYVIGYDPLRASATGIVVQMLQAFREVVVVALIVSAALSIFATIRRTDRPFIPIIVLAAAWTGLLLVGASVIPVSTTRDSPPQAVFPEGRIVRIGEVLIYSPAGSGSGGGLPAHVVVRDAGAPPRISLFPGRKVQRSDGLITIGEQAFDLSEMEISYPGMVSVPAQLGPMIRDIRTLTGLVLGDGESGGQPDPLMAVAFGVFLLMCWTPARMTRWPLFNVVFVFLSIRAALWLVHSIHFGELGSLVNTVVRQDQLGLVTAGALAFVSLVFAVVLILMPPLSSWKREVGHD